MFPTRDSLTICFAHAAYRMKDRFELRDTGIKCFEVRAYDDLVKRIGEAREDLAKIQAQREVPREVVPDGEIRFKVERVPRRGRVERDAGPMRLVAVRAERVSDEAVNEVLKRAGLKVGDAVTEESLKKLRAAAAGVDEHLRVVMSDDGQGGITVKIVS